MITRNKRLGTSLNYKAAIPALGTLLLNFLNMQEKYICLSHCYLWDVCYTQLNKVIMYLVLRIGSCKTGYKICRWPREISERKIQSTQILKAGKPSWSQTFGQVVACYILETTCYHKV